MLRITSPTLHFPVCERNHVRPLCGRYSGRVIQFRSIYRHGYPASEEVQTLTIARVENNRYISEAIEAFNTLGMTRKLESVWYSGNEGELKLALVSGDGTDLVSLDEFEYETYAVGISLIASTDIKSCPSRG